jgi:hypothetical protein
MNEFSTADVKDVKSPSLENYKNIKPQEKHTVKETNDFWKNEFDNASKDVKSENLDEDKHKEYTDDDGKLYRIDNELLPNNEYKSNEYEYKTDECGRIASVEGKLRLRDDDSNRSMESYNNLKNQDYKEGDERGHLIGRLFGGSDKLENLVPMSKELNHGDYAKLERTLASAVGDGVDVRLKVEPKYEGDSNRPTEFRITYSIDGDKEVVVFKNGSEGK